ncbi:Transposase [Singulisphaera sp. GP187]|uniref:ISL3 family transposase n=1 Tax=Singulisphaera sp. GP187 TaxID=1882752 RepID=UPI00092BB176|nr:ISL3 family transposase [Singulisphaera sp. GP187]SIO58671.1 Transposase [Singulisphaera sp. GP187]
MQLKTILNRVHPLKSFVYEQVRLVEESGGPVIEIVIQPRANSQPVCSGCGRKRRGYDRQSQRRFQFIPLWGMAVTFLYTMRRVDCPGCGVVVEMVPWAEGKNHLTIAYRWFLATWAKRLSWKEVAEVFHTTWENVFRSVKMAVTWGLEHRNLDGIKAIGVDEIQWHKGHKYLTLVYQIDDNVQRLLWVGEDRTTKSFLRFFRMLGKERSAAIKYVCSDMWGPYLKVIAKKASKAIHVLDRYHIMAKMNKAIDEVRADEAKRLKQKGKTPVLKNSRWCLLKRPENLTEKQTVKLSELLKCNLKAVRAYLLREDFQRFWEYRSPAWAEKFLKEWCTRTMRSKIEPMKKMARTLRSHEGLILNWFRAKGTMSSGVVEGLNNKVKLTMRKSYGFRTSEAIELALFHTLGALPEPNHTHRFC